MIEPRIERLATSKSTGTPHDPPEYPSQILAEL